jgi:uncharacterized oligopeptide transporter (OPT) family protein
MHLVTMLPNHFTLLIARPWKHVSTTRLCSTRALLLFSFFISFDIHLSLVEYLLGNIIMQYITQKKNSDFCTFLTLVLWYHLSNGVTGYILNLIGKSSLVVNGVSSITFTNNSSKYIIVTAVRNARSTYLAICFTGYLCGMRNFCDWMLPAD